MNAETGLLHLLTLTVDQFSTGRSYIRFAPVYGDARQYDTRTGAVALSLNRRSHSSSCSLA